MATDEVSQRLEVALWHAGLKAEHRQAAVQIAKLTELPAANAVDALKGWHPEWFASPRITAHDAIWPATQHGMDYLTASREDRDRKLWSQAGAPAEAPIDSEES